MVENDEIYDIDTFGTFPFTILAIPTEENLLVELRTTNSKVNGAIEGTLDFCLTLDEAFTISTDRIKFEIPPIN